MGKYNEIEKKKMAYPIEEDPYYVDRCDLAATFRWFARLDMHEGIANHFSYAVSTDGSKFLMNPNALHFSRVRASDLILIDANDPSTMNRPDAPDPTAWAIHGSIHRNHENARCLMHLHPHYATALASLKDNTMYPVDQNTMRFFNRVSVDGGFDGMGVGDEAERLATTLGDNRVLMMGNHGVLTLARTIAQAFDEMYYFERSARNYITALQTGKPLSIVNDEVAEKTAQQWEAFDNSALHLQQVREILDSEGADYKN